MHISTRTSSDLQAFSRTKALIKETSNTNGYIEKTRKVVYVILFVSFTVIYDFLFYTNHHLTKLVTKKAPSQTSLKLFLSYITGSTNQRQLLKIALIGLATIGIFAIGISLSRPQKPHLYLYLDLNKTLIASDKVSSKTPKAAVLESIAYKITAIWDDTIKKPISYFEYITEHTYCNAKYLTKPLPHFIGKYLKGYIKSQQKKQIQEVLNVIKNNNYKNLSHSYDEGKKMFDLAITVLESQIKVDKKQVFKSFYKLIDYLNSEKLSYTIILRTFGKDASEVVKELNQYDGFNPITANNFYQLKDNTLYQLSKNAPKKLNVSLHELVLNSKNNLAIQDDYNNWAKQHNEEWKYGKLFPFNLAKNTLSLFFDDNAVHNPRKFEKNIIYPYDVSKKAATHPSKLIQANKIFPVDMFKAVCEENYYINLVKKALNTF